MTDQTDTIQLVSETATLQKRDRVTARVRVSTTTHTGEELVSAELERSDVEVTRVSIDREIDVAPPVRTQGELTIIPVVEEILVVERRLVLREEIHIRQITTTQSVELPVTLRKQHAVVERDELPTNRSEEEK